MVGRDEIVEPTQGEQAFGKRVGAAPEIINRLSPTITRRLDGWQTVKPGVSAAC
jgi:hypothetical protein